MIRQPSQRPGWSGNPEVSISDGADHADGEEDDGADEFEDAADRDADDAEGNQEQPNNGVGDEGDQSQRPAENEKDAEEQEFRHGVLPNRIPKIRDPNASAGLLEALESNLIVTHLPGAEFPLTTENTERTEN